MTQQPLIVCIRMKCKEGTQLFDTLCQINLLSQRYGLLYILERLIGLLAELNHSPCQPLQFILEHIKHDIQHAIVSEEPISPECRLGICLYRLARGDYFYTIAEMVGLGVAIVKEVTESIIANLWNLSVEQHMPKTKEDFEKKILDMEEL